MNFSVIIPAHRRPELLAECLAALAPEVHTFPSGDYEVIVSDDSPAEESLEPMIQQQFPWARWIQGPRRGPAANRNYGAAHALGKWVAFVDDDCLPDRQLLNSYFAAQIENPGARVFEGRTYADRPQRSLAECAPLNDHGGYLWACNFVIERALFDRIGGFDERFLFAAMEDVELRQRLHDLAYTPVFVPEAAVCHPWRKRRPISEVRRHRQSLQTYILLRPQAASLFNFRSTVMTTLRIFSTSTLPKAFRFRGKGLASALMEHAYTIYSAVFHPLKASDPPQSSQRQKA